MLNQVYLFYTEQMDREQIEEFDRALEAKFDSEMTPAELARERRRRKAAEIGAIKGQAEALGAMRMRNR